MLTNRQFLTGLALGIGGTLAARGVGPALAPLALPLFKRGMKTAILGYERGRELAAELAENFSDVMAEVEAELQAERTSAPVTGNGVDLHGNLPE